MRSSLKKKLKQKELEMIKKNTSHHSGSGSGAVKHSKDSNVHSDMQHMSIIEELRNETLRSLTSRKSNEDKGSSKAEFEEESVLFDEDGEEFEEEVKNNKSRRTAGNSKSVSRV